MNVKLDKNTLRNAQIITNDELARILDWPPLAIRLNAQFGIASNNTELFAQQRIRQLALADAVSTLLPAFKVGAKLSAVQHQPTPIMPIMAVIDPAKLHHAFTSPMKPLTAEQRKANEEKRQEQYAAQVAMRNQILAKDVSLTKLAA